MYVFGSFVYLETKLIYLTIILYSLNIMWALLNRHIYFSLLILLFVLLLSQEAIPREVSSVDKLINGSTDVIENEKNDNTCQNLTTDVHECSEVSDDFDKRKPVNNDTLSVSSETALPHLTEPRGSKRSHDVEELGIDNKKTRTIIIDSDDETHTMEDETSICKDTKMEDSSLLEKGNGADSVCADSTLSKSPDKNFLCTACDKLAVVVHQHPLLKVIVCGDCKCLIEEKMNVKVCNMVRVVHTSDLIVAVYLYLADRVLNV